MESEHICEVLTEIEDHYEKICAELKELRSERVQIEDRIRHLGYQQSIFGNAAAFLEKTITDC